MHKYTSAKPLAIQALHDVPAATRSWSTARNWPIQARYHIMPLNTRLSNNTQCPTSLTTWKPYGHWFSNDSESLSLGKYSHDQLCQLGGRSQALLNAMRHFSSGPKSSFFWDSPRKRDIILTDPRLSDRKLLGKAIEDEYAVMREKYDAPKNPIVLCHGLLGFDELRLAGSFMPGIAYWRGIGEGLTALGAEVITTVVPASGSIELRSKALMAHIEAKAAEKSVNLIGHSMGGIDCRYMISQLKPDKFKVASLTTIATPHQGSSFADYVFEFIGRERLPRLYKAMGGIGLETGAFAQLTTSYMQNTFNPLCPDVEGVKYYSYGAIAKPGIFSPFRQPQKIIWEREGPNDGLVSVQSAKHGEYRGTLIGPTHLDIINWTNRLKWMIMERRFNAIAFYCDIADMLAKEGL